MVLLTLYLNHFELASPGHPGWGPRRKVDMSRPRWTHDGGVVRSILHGLETRKNARKSEHERTKGLMKGAFET